MNRRIFGIAAIVGAIVGAVAFVRSRAGAKGYTPHVVPIQGGATRADSLRAQAYDVNGQPIPTEGIFLEPLDPSRFEKEAPPELRQVTTLQTRLGQQNEHNPSVATLVGTLPIPVVQQIAGTLSPAEREELARQFAVGKAFATIKTLQQEMATRFA